MVDIFFHASFIFIGEVDAATDVVHRKAAPQGEADELGAGFVVVARAEGLPLRGKQGPQGREVGVGVDHLVEQGA